MNGGQGGVPRPGSEPASRATPASELIDRLRRVLRPEDLDCACRERLDGALERFDQLERRRESRRQLAKARDHKERIAALLGFLSDLDSLTEAESDRSVFEEMALLFAEIGRSAQAGAAALREL
ncbi:MAG TPA: hypothetical protein VGO06_20270 [Bosea sp. (in: a-proteobacteria)]|jgi:hypothetical protein|uniref:hypothetical protein n=1 Tax=Bosea sp. (in: a-proteobacteria) TaxID=1871050 RepID=UPI002E150555|nr:hypothetical protein [Bosea sp. (in: a-proteobacteria)]